MVILNIQESQTLLNCKIFYVLITDNQGYRIEIRNK